MIWAMYSSFIRGDLLSYGAEQTHVRSKFILLSDNFASKPENASNSFYQNNIAKNVR